MHATPHLELWNGLELDGIGDAGMAAGGKPGGGRKPHPPPVRVSTPVTRPTTRRRSKNPRPTPTWVTGYPSGDPHPPLGSRSSADNGDLSAGEELGLAVVWLVSCAGSGGGLSELGWKERRRPGQTHVGSSGVLDGVGGSGGLDGVGQRQLGLDHA
jgi:hypothetical protein